jgi:hypothetical protein
MGEATLYGLGASSALLIGALIGTLWRPNRALSQAALAFASGALAAAVSVELFSDASAKTGALWASAALLAGAVVFIAIDTWLDKRIARAGQTGLPSQPPSRSTESPRTSLSGSRSPSREASSCSSPSSPQPARVARRRSLDA